MHCLKSENGVCSKCEEGTFLGIDNRCSEIEHCIKTNDFLACQECEDGYYYNLNYSSCNSTSDEENEDFKNCKRSDDEGVFCYECKDDFYLNRTDNLCYSNKGRENKFYKCQKTNPEGNQCQWCINGYHIGGIDKKCSLIKDCAVIKQDEKEDKDDKCIRCEDHYCLNSKTGTCELFNFYVIDEETKMFFNCNTTNEEASACGECIDDYTLNKKGFCYNPSFCEIEDEDNEGECKKCIEGESPFSFCINKNFGCVENYFNENCFRCDDDMNFDNCTECKEGYELTLSEIYEGEYVCTPIEDK